MIILRARGSMSRKNLQGGKVCAGSRGSKLTGSIGFTLIELMVALAIVTILASLSIPMYAEYIEKARIVRAIAEIRIISQVINAYQLENGAYPNDLAAVNYATLLDPWGSSYQYINIQTTRGNGPLRKLHGIVPINTDYDLYSMGKDRQSQSSLTARASKDDIIRANDGGYIGLASEF
jgi:general secretion pathway protein G